MKRCSVCGQPSRRDERGKWLRTCSPEHAKVAMRINAQELAKRRATPGYRDEPLTHGPEAAAARDMHRLWTQGLRS